MTVMTRDEPNDRLDAKRKLVVDKSLALVSSQVHHFMRINNYVCVSVCVHTCNWCAFHLFMP